MDFLKRAEDRYAECVRAVEAAGFEEILTWTEEDADAFYVTAKLGEDLKYRMWADLKRQREAIEEMKRWRSADKYKDMTTGEIYTLDELEEAYRAVEPDLYERGITSFEEHLADALKRDMMRKVD